MKKKFISNKANKTFFQYEVRITGQQSSCKTSLKQIAQTNNRGYNNLTRKITSKYPIRLETEYETRNIN